MKRSRLFIKTIMSLVVVSEIETTDVNGHKQTFTFVHL